MPRLLIEPRPYSLIRAQKSRAPLLLPRAAHFSSLSLSLQAAARKRRRGRLHRAKTSTTTGELQQTLEKRPQPAHYPRRRRERNRKMRTLREPPLQEERPPLLLL